MLIAAPWPQQRLHEVVGRGTRIESHVDELIARRLLQRAEENVPERQQVAEILVVVALVSGVMQSVILRMAD